MSRGVLLAYVASVVAASVMGAARLYESTEMPGLAAVELVLLALPWSLTLGVEPISSLGIAGMAGLVLTGAVLNILVLWQLVRRLRNSP
jgi:hypothetical protein